MARLNRTFLLANRKILGELVVSYDDSLPERVIQFGEGNFLRGFIDWMIQQLNNKGLFNGRVVAVQPTPHGKVVPKINAQDGLYTLVLQGISQREVIDQSEIISSISRGINPYTDWHEVLKVAENPNIQFVFSNTTEAGISYVKEAYDGSQAPLSFPGKLTAFLHHRYEVMNGDPSSGLIVIPCELVENNGDLLKEIVLTIAQDWSLPSGFMDWVNRYNQFCNTLVDRIVTGYPKDNIEEFQNKLGYEDALLTVGEPYHLFVIQAGDDVAEQLPFHQVGLNVQWGDVKPFRDIKVRILNGAHTMMCPVAYLAGCDTVRQAMQDRHIHHFILQGIYEEILPVLKTDKEQTKAFADSVIERFSNPFTKHYLLDIALNSVNKFKTRLLPTLLDWQQTKRQIPKRIAFSLAALIAFYRPRYSEGSVFGGRRGAQKYPIRDNGDIVIYFRDQWQRVDNGELTIRQMVDHILLNTTLWEENLAEIPSLSQLVAVYLQDIVEHGMTSALRRVIVKETSGQ
ncbi:Mannitol dehydrogenase domain-containing protein [Caldalkalibacillus thermarum TA2.A1]|uniref:Mannitol dehydrogenase domain-containing protein n=1 Tax=Caldalkalibacillus thermarum (strain TA2.A1) TaxID=986075 RepID=F5LAT2_CALTT|nr:tagaturonate reductase [Caldalkalibacillus thermarum]EGL81471.1 Mannitol dehydrogenase domain-containing protein [Caldalkalibacillus thermarum TA2.A1]